MVKVDVIGLKGLQSKIEKSTGELRKQISTNVRAAADEFRDLAIKDAPGDTGDLRGKISVKEIHPLSYEVVSGSEYSAPMEFGTKGKFKAIPGIDSSEFQGKPQGSWKDFLKNIENWVHRKGIAGTYRAVTYDVKTRKAARIRRTGGKKRQQAEDKQLAYVIARSIYKNGIEPQPFFFKQFPIVKKNLLTKLKSLFK